VHPRERTVYPITDVPTDTLDTTPELFIVATPGEPLPHVPPEVASESVVPKPKHMLVVPVIGASATTVTVDVVAHPVGAV